MNNIKQILLSLTACISLLAIGAERPPQPPKLSTFMKTILQGEEDRKKQILEETFQRGSSVQLIANDGQSFTLPQEIAFQSPAIEDLVNMDKTSQITFKMINSATLRKIVSILAFFYKHKDLRNKALLDAVAHDAESIFKEPGKLELLKAFDFLDFKPGMELIARFIIKNEKLIDAAKEMIRKGQIGDTPAKEIARYYFLFTGADLSEIDKNSYGFSIRDYLDYMPQNITKGRWVFNRGEGSWSLSSLRLRDLDGLHDISNAIHDLEYLDLSNNQLTELVPGTFQEFNKLKTLDFRHNRLTNLAPDVLQGLHNLEWLGFGNNKLRQIELGALKGLDSLWVLDLANNQLTLLQPGIFQGVSNMRRVLSLSHNQLEQLLPATFQELGNLKALNLDNNRLTDLAPGSLQGLTSLEWLNLEGNRLSRVTPEELRYLPRLNRIDLRNNQLTEENKKQIRSILPNNALIIFEVRKFVGLSPQ